MKLKDKIAIVTGAGTGIGKAIAKLFCSHGASVALVGRSRTPLETVVTEITAQGGSAVAVPGDVGDPQQVTEMVLQTSTHFGGLDIVVNNAAISVARKLEDLSYQEWNEVLQANLTGQFLLAKAAVPAMRKRGGGSVINISSIHQKISEPGASAYAASKGGIAQLTRSLAIELAPFNVLVNSISPGFVGNTKLSMVDGVDETTTSHFQNYYLDSGRIPLRRAGTASDIAAATLFLAARECTYMTGTDLVVDGGLSLTL